MTTAWWLAVLMIPPIAGAAFAWIKFHTIAWWETAVSLLVALIVIWATLFISDKLSSSDTYTQSGRITQVIHTPYWHARWTETERYTVRDSKGNKSTRTRTVTKNRDYPPTWKAITTVGELTITKDYYSYIAKEHGEEKKRGFRPHFDHGDRNDYFSYVKDDPEFCNYPVTNLFNWENHLKNSNSILKQKKISPEQAQKLKLFNYPENDHFLSSRLIGGVPISAWDWDKMNSAISLKKQVNLILVNCGNNTLEYAKNLQSFWQNGKKNDLILCYGGNPRWSYVFGWSNSELVKQNLATLLLDKEINKAIVDDIKNEVVKNFKPFKWEQTEQIGHPVPITGVCVAFVLVCASQAVCFMFFNSNNHGKRNRRKRLF